MSTQSGAANAHDEVRFGSELLYVIAEFDRLVSDGVSPELALADLGSRLPERLSHVLEALRNAHHDEQQAKERSVSLEQLRSGMILVEDIVATNGQKLIGARTEISPSTLNVLKRYAELSIVKEPIRALDPTR